MNHTFDRSKLLTKTAVSRGERLYPARSNANYWILTRLRQGFEAIIDKFVVGKNFRTLIDYGCGNMPYRMLFEPHLEKYVGYDFPENELAEYHLTSETTLTVEDESTDIVLSSQVLEHVCEPNSYLAESYRVLKTGRLLFLSTHGQYRYHPDPKDYWRWTCEGLRRQICQAGFEILHFQGVLGPEATSLILLQYAVLPRIPWRLKRIFRIYMQWRIRRADKLCSDLIRDKDACVYLVVAKKKVNMND